VADPTFKNYSAKLEIDRQVSRDVLTYVSFNRGTKSGGFEASVATPFGGLKQQFVDGIPYGQERLNAIELGAKSTLFNERLRLNGDVFHYDYAGYQGFEQIGPLESIKNLNAREWGAEVEVEAKPVAGLTLSSAVSSLHSILYNVTEPSLYVQNTQLPQTPHFSANALVRYEQAALGGVVSVQMTGRYWDSFCWSVFCGAVDVERPGYTADARISYDNGRALFAVAVTNMTNRVYRVFDSDLTSAGGIILASYAPPRWYTASVTVKFGQGK
jgi:iron complex outermembrane receptor protein